VTLLAKKRERNRTLIRMLRWYVLEDLIGVKFKQLPCWRLTIKCREGLEKRKNKNAANYRKKSGFEVNQSL
jgi:hypothetical protein